MSGTLHDKTELPDRLRSRIRLAEFFDRLGRCLYPGAWQDDEIAAPEILPYEEVLKLKEEQNEKRHILEKKVRCSDEAYVKKAFRDDETTGYLFEIIVHDREEAADPYSVCNLIYRLHVIADDLAGCPPVDDRAEYEKRYQALERRRRTEELILELLADGRVTAYSKTDCGHAPVEAEFWQASNTTVDFEHSTGRWPAKKQKYQFFRLRLDEITGILQKISAAARPTYRSTRDTRETATAYLINLMAPGQPRQRKETVIKDLQEKFPLLNGRASADVWREACERSGSGWNKRGRPKGH